MFGALKVCSSFTINFTQMIPHQPATGPATLRMDDLFRTCSCGMVQFMFLDSCSCMLLTHERSKFTTNEIYVMLCFHALKTASCSYLRKYTIICFMPYTTDYLVFSHPIQTHYTPSRHTRFKPIACQDPSFVIW